MARDYKKEYAAYHSSPEQKKNRAMRNAARREAERDGKVSKGDGKDVAHKKALISGGGNGKSNLKVQDKAANRGWRKGQSGYQP
jgi:hypothetical protein